MLDCQHTFVMLSYFRGAGGLRLPYGYRDERMAGFMGVYESEPRVTSRSDTRATVSGSSSYAAGGKVLTQARSGSADVKSVSIVL